MTTRYADAARTIVLHNGASIPAVVGNVDYDALVSAGTAIRPYEPPALTAADIDYAFAERISVIGSLAKRASMQSEKIELQALVVAGQDLTADQIFDAATMASLNQFETRMIEIRQAAKNSMPQSLAAIPWITPADVDATLTPEFLAKFLSGY
jgi:hypothetical protein